MGAFTALVKSFWRSTWNSVALYWLRRRFRRRASVAPAQFVAFIDVLGFSNRLSTWDAALDFYLEMISTTRRALDRWHSEWTLENGSAHTEPVDMTIISDSIILSSDSLIKIAKASAFLQANALKHGVLLRGSIAFGRHFTFAFSHGHLILSDGLGKAVAEEKEAKFPRITIHPALLQNLEAAFFQQEEEGLRRALKTDFELFLQSEDGRWCVNPFLDSRDLPRMKEELVRLLDQTDESTPSVKEKLLWLAHALNYWIVAPREKMWMSRLYDQDPNAYLDALAAAYDILPEFGHDIVPTWRYSRKLDRFFDMTFSDTTSAILLCDADCSAYRNLFNDNVTRFTNPCALVRNRYTGKFLTGEPTKYWKRLVAKRAAVLERGST